MKMYKRLLAAFLVVTFLLGIGLMAVPAMAHTTIGRPIETVPYAVRDSDTNGGHVPGVTGYVWPGGGKNWWLDSATEPPGYQNPWGSYPAEVPSSTWWQLRGNAYAPFGAILTSTDEVDNVGDLIFAINFTLPEGYTSEDFEGEYVEAKGYSDVIYHDLMIYIPPEFEPYDHEAWEGGVGYADPSIATTINVPYGGTQLQTFECDVAETDRGDVKDPFGPNWWVITIPGDISFTYDNDYGEWYYVRVNNIVAPQIAGRYFFKMFVNWSFPLGSAVDDNGDIVDWDGDDGELDINDYIFSAMPAENWPALLVKGEIDPGIVEGTVFTRGWDVNFAESPLLLPGRVRLEGEAYDPYTFEPLGRTVEARGYFNASAKGHFVVEGVAPGVYDVYASTAGYPELLVYEGIEVHAGKSVHVDLYLQPGAIVWGEIFSKHAFGEVPWAKELPVMVEIYDSNDWPEPFMGGVWGAVDGTVPDNWYEWEADHLMAWSPINLTDAPYTSYVNGPQVLFEPLSGVILDRYGSGGADTPAVDEFQRSVTPREVAFPWEGTHPMWNTGVAGLDDKDPDGIFNGVGPAQSWWTDPNAGSFTFRFGNKDYSTYYGIYGAPTEFDGHVPQIFATWVNGLMPGTYYLRAWINGYVQTDASGNYVDYMFTVGGDEWAGDIFTPMDLQLNGIIEKEVHFQYQAGSLKEVPAWWGDGQGEPLDLWRFLIVEARDAAGTLVAFNFTQVDADATGAVVQLNGFGMAGPIIYPDWDWNEFPFHYSANNLMDPTDMKFSLYQYRHIRDYGMMPGTYTVYAYMRGFVEQEYEMASISLSGDKTIISDHLYVGGGINITIYSIDWQHPRVDRPWKYPGTYLTVDIYNSEDVMVGTAYYFNNVGGEGQWIKTVQGPEGTMTVPWPGWGEDYSKVKFHGSTWLERYGPEETIGAYTPSNNDEMATLWQRSYHGLGFLYADWAYRDADFNTKLGLETDTYHFDVYTYGYVFKEPEKYTLFVAKGSQGDTKINLMCGVEIQYTIIFKKEGLIEPIPYDMFVDVLVLDADGNVVGDSWPDDTFPETGHYTVPAGTAQITGVVIAGINDGWCSWGMDGYPNYVDDWTIIVHTSYQLRDVYNDVFYPPPPGIMMGMWGDSAVGKWGPYEMRTEVVVPNVHLCGEASVIFEMDQRALLTGQIAGFTWSNELRPVSWANVMISGAEGELTVYSLDGIYELYAPRGDYDLTIEAYSGDAGYYSQTVGVTAPDGGAVTYNFLNMERSGVAIPEFPTALIAIISALGASLFIFRKAKTTKK